MNRAAAHRTHIAQFGVSHNPGSRSFAQSQQVRPQFIDRLSDGRTLRAELMKTMAFDDIAGTFEGGGCQATMRIDNVGRCWVGDEPRQVQHVAKGTNRSTKTNPTGYAVGCEGIGAEPIVESFEQRIGGGEVDLWDSVEDDGRRTHQTWFKGGEQRPGDSGSEGHLGQRVHLGMRHDRSRQMRIRVLGRPVAPTGDH